MMAGMWTLDWEGGCKDGMNQPCKPATNVSLQCTVPSGYSVSDLLDGRLICERKIPVKLCSRRSKPQVSENHTLAFVSRKEGRGKTGVAMKRQSQVWEGVIWGYTVAEGEHDRTSSVKEKRNKKAVVESNSEVYNCYSIFLFWTWERMLGSVFLYCHRLLWNALARYNLHSLWQSIETLYAYTYRQMQRAVCCQCFCVKPGLMKKL